jgi:hypothetical protein
VGNWASVCDAGDLSTKALSRGDYSLLPPTKVGNTLTCLATLQPKPSTRPRATHFAAGYVALLQHRLQLSSLGRMADRRSLACQAQLPRRRRLLPLFVGRGLRTLRREIVGGVSPAMRYISLPQAPRSMVLQRSEQKGRQGFSGPQRAGLPHWGLATMLDAFTVLKSRCSEAPFG